MSAAASARGFAAWAESMHLEYDAFLRQSWAAMQAARKGHWIADTQEHVRQAGEAFRQKALEKLLQARVAAGQGPFSPSAGHRLDEQGAADGDAPDPGAPGWGTCGCGAGCGGGPTTGWTCRPMSG